MNTIRLILEGYRMARTKSHGVRASRRLALALAITRLYAATGRPARLVYWLYFKTPDWVKTAPWERKA